MYIKKIFDEKKLFFFRLILALFFSCCFLFASCSKDCHEELLGKWVFSQKLRQELYLDLEGDEEEAYFGDLYVKQTITYTFNEDMTYEKYIHHIYTEATPSEMINPQYDINDYVGVESLAIINGEYEVTEKVIKLKAKTISFGNDERMDYAEYYLMNSEIGAQNTSRKYTKDGDTLIINSRESGLDDKFTRATD